MLFDEALAAAEEYFNKNSNSSVSSALDAQTHWIFYGGDKNVVEIGSAGIKINKESGIVENFFLPDEENFILLDNSIKIEL